MKKCTTCNIEFDGGRKLCPLCHNALTGVATSTNWPPLHSFKKRALLYKLQLFIVLAAIVISLSLDLLLKLNNGVHYSLLILMWGLTAEFLIKTFIKRNSFPSKIVSISVVTLSVLLGITSYYLGFFDPIFYLVIPIIISATIVSNFVFTFIDKRGNAMIYLLATIIIGIVPYIVLAIVQKESILVWNICWMISIVCALGIIVFKGKKVLIELQKRFNF